MSDPLDVERAHEDQWYRRVTTERFFEREGFRRLIAANLDALRRSVPITPQTRVLSLGCGSGEYERLLATECQSVIGVDLSEVAVTYARDRAARAGLTNIRFVSAPIEDVDVADGSIDLVVIFGVLHHLDARQRAGTYARVRRCLVPGGWAYSRDPNARGLLRRVAGPLARRDEFHSPNEAALDPAATAGEWAAAGFTDVRVDYTDVMGGPLPWMLPVSSSLLWSAVFAFDRAWLGVPALRRLASQFAVAARAAMAGTH